MPSGHTIDRSEAKELSVKDWILTMIILAIPIVNIIMLFVWGFGEGTNPNKRNYARAALIIAAIAIVLYLIFAIVFFRCAERSMSMS